MKRVTTKFFKVEGIKVELGFIEKRDGCMLIISKDSYQNRTTNLIFPQKFIDQETGIEYQLYDVFELDDKTISATYI